MLNPAALMRVLYAMNQNMTPKQRRAALATIRASVAAFETHADPGVRECWLPEHKESLALAQKLLR
jgi:hypothetical protein